MYGADFGLTPCGLAGCSMKKKELAHDFHKPLFCAYTQVSAKCTVTSLCFLPADLGPPSGSIKALSYLESLHVCSRVMLASPGRLGHLYLAASLHPDDVVLSFPGRPLPPLSRAYRVLSRFLLLPYSRRSRFLDVCASPFMPSRLGYAPYGSMSKNFFFEVAAGVEPALIQALQALPTRPYSILPVVPDYRLSPPYLFIASESAAIPRARRTARRAGCPES